MSGFCSLLFFLLLLLAITVPCSRSMLANCSGTPKSTHPWVERSGNQVNLTSCSGTLYYRSFRSDEVYNEMYSCLKSGTLTTFHAMRINYTSTITTVNQTTEGVYTCYGGLGSCPEETLIEIPRVTVTNNSFFKWGQRAVIICGYQNRSNPVVTWEVPVGQKFTLGLGRERDRIGSWIENNDLDLYISSFNPLLGGNFTCEVEINSLCSAAYIISHHQVTVEKNDSITNSFINNITHRVMRPDTNNMAPSTNNMTNFYCSASVSSSDVYIAFELFESVEHFSLDECCGSSRSGCLINNGTAYKCDKTFGHINVAAICDYSTPYHINCNFTLMAPAQSQRNASTVACHIMDGVSSTSITNINTGLIIKDDGPLAAPQVSPKDNQSVNISITFPFSLPSIFKRPEDLPTLDILIRNKYGDVVQRIPINNDSISTITDSTILATVNLIETGNYAFSYSVSFFGEEAENSSWSGFVLISNPRTPQSNTINISPTTMISTLSSTPESSHVVETSTPVSLPIIVGGVGAGVVIILSLILLACLICLGYFCKFCKRKKKYHSHNLQSFSPARLTSPETYHNINNQERTIEMLEDSPYHANTHRLQPMNPSMNGDSFNHSAMSLINSEHPSHICNCSCHTVSSRSHSSGPSNSSAASYAHLNLDLPRYGHPDAEYHPPPYNRHRTTYELKRQEEMIDDDIRRSRVAPDSLNLTSERKDIPSLNVVLPTPVMINQQAVLSPTDSNGTEPFGSEPNTPGVPLEGTDGNNNSASKRPNKLAFRQEKESITDNIQLAVMLFLQHKDCNDRGHCQCCKMITKQFEKISQELGKDTLDRAIKDIQTPGTEGHRQLLRRKGRTPARTPRVGFQLGFETKRNRSSSTSEVHDNELTFSSTETEEDDLKNVRRLNFRRATSRKAHTDDELERSELEKDDLFLPINAVPKEIIHSEPDLTPTPVLPPSMTLYQGATPTNPLPCSVLPIKQDSLPSDDSGSTDESSTSSRPNSNPRLDNINPLDGTSTSLLTHPNETSSSSLSFKKHNSFSSSGYTSSTDNEREKGNEQATRNYNGVNHLQPLTGSDTEYSDSDASFSSPAHLLPKSQPKQKQHNINKHLGSSLAKKPIQYPPSMSSSTSNGRHSPSPSNSSRKSQSPSHSSYHHNHPPSLSSGPKHISPINLPPPPSNCLSPYGKPHGTTTHHHSSRHTDNGSIHSSQSASRAMLLDNSDQSSSSSTQSVHSDSFMYPQNGSHHHHHSHHHHNPYRGPPSNGSSRSGSMLRLPQSSSTATPL